jgi:thiosulfate reductase cytochrome b subunit
MTSATTGGKGKPAVFRQTFGAKLFHWLNLVSLVLMISSGLQIYNANPVFGGRAGWHFPQFLLLGGWLAGGRHWHFAAMWLFSINLLGYGLYILCSRRWLHRFAASGDLQALRVSQNSKRRLYAWHRLIYTAIIPVLLLAIVSGLALYKPAQLHGLAALFGDWQTLRLVHFLTVPIVLLFAVGHVGAAFKIGRFRLVKSIFS